jgi:hypothetical protein
MPLSGGTGENGIIIQIEVTVSFTTHIYIITSCFKTQ